jgi:hypothetical protein
MTTIITKPETIDQALDAAADILEAGVWVKHRCYDSKTGGHCALGAIAVPFYPDVDPIQIDSLGWTEDHTEFDRDPMHLAAVDYFADFVGRRYSYSGLSDRDITVYRYNDERVESSEEIVAKLRAAAEQYRQENV